MLNSEAMKNRGKFITFEGIEGSGKSTQIEKVFQFLKSKNHDAIQSLEPGGTKIGKEFRRILLSPTMEFASKYSELLLFYVDRLEHVENLILPSLKQGKVVLCDRYIDSSYAYQIGGRNMPEELLQDLNKLVNLQPDITILLDIAPEVSLERARLRSAFDRFEQEQLDFHIRVRERYLVQAKREPERIKVIKADNLNPQEVFEEIVKILNKHL
jgi:dTMP kinase